MLVQTSEDHQGVFFKGRDFAALNWAIDHGLLHVNLFIDSLSLFNQLERRTFIIYALPLNLFVLSLFLWDVGSLSLGEGYGNFQSFLENPL